MENNHHSKENKTSPVELIEHNSSVDYDIALIPIKDFHFGYLSI